MTPDRTHRSADTGRPAAPGLEELHDRLREAVEALESGEQWQAWLRFARGFHRYSFQQSAPAAHASWRTPCELIVLCESRLAEAAEWACLTPGAVIISLACNALNRLLRRRRRSATRPPLLGSLVSLTAVPTLHQESTGATGACSAPSSTQPAGINTVPGSGRASTMPPSTQPPLPSRYAGWFLRVGHAPQGAARTGRRHAVGRVRPAGRRTPAAGRRGRGMRGLTRTRRP